MFKMTKVMCVVLMPALNTKTEFFDGFAGVAGSIIGGLFGSSDTDKRNQANLEMMREQNVFNADQANINRAFVSDEANIARLFSAHQADVARGWQAYMSNTQYQRAVGDLQRAGLNPMLAYTQGGASAGPISSGGSVNQASSSAASSAGMIPQMGKAALAAQLAQSAVTVGNLVKQGANIEADTALKAAQAERETASAGNLKYQSDRIVQGEIPKLRAEIIEVERRGLVHTAEYELKGAISNLTKMQAMVASGQISQVEANTVLTKLETALKMLDIPEKQAMSEKFKTEWGKDVSPYFKEAIDALRVLVYGAGRR